MSKTFTIDNYSLEIAAPGSLSFDNPFYANVYEALYNNVLEPHYSPQIDVDKVHEKYYNFDIVSLANMYNIKVPLPSSRATNKDRLKTQKALMLFLEKYPEFSGFLRNTTSSAKIAIRNGEKILGANCDANNFIEIKRIIDKLNSKSWDREQDTSESQSGVSTLGTISEKLLEYAFSSLVDNENFFKVNYSEVQSYGDFVLMCLPNNLWISVKSNFARERLLASGYNNDILAVGFFQDHTEFTSPVRIRNLQRAGFLAMYCPDSPVTTEQLKSNSSTYEEVLLYYKKGSLDLPDNINGQPFIRKLSSLGKDLKRLLDVKNIQKRNTVGF